MSADADFVTEVLLQLHRGALEPWLTYGMTQALKPLQQHPTCAREFIL
jgi:hypothetical protein